MCTLRDATWQPTLPLDGMTFAHVRDYVRYMPCRNACVSTCAEARWCAGAAGQLPALVRRRARMERYFLCVDRKEDLKGPKSVGCQRGDGRRKVKG